MQKRWATEAAQRCTNDSCPRLLHKHQLPKWLESPAHEAKRWNEWLRA